MADIYNEQRVLGIRLVADGTLMHNGLPVIGVSDVAATLFSNNQRALGVAVLDADQAIYNEQPVRGAVLIDDGRTLYNGQLVAPASAVVGQFAGETNNIIVSSTAQFSTATASIANNFTSRRSDWASPQGDITDIRCVDYRHAVDSSGVTTGGARTIKRYLEYPAGVFHQVKWAAATTIALNTTTSYTSDVIVSSVSGLPLVIPAGTKFWWRTVNVSGATVTTFPVIVRPDDSVTLGLDDGNDVTDKGNSGTISATTGNNTFGPNGVIGTVLAANARAFLVVGDSLAFGQGDVSSVGANGSSGWISRGLAGSYPVCKIAATGVSAQTIAASWFASPSFLPALARLGFTDVICEAGINDLSQVSRTPAQILTDHQTMYTTLVANNLFGTERIWQTTMTARTDSTDGYATTANQTPKVDGTYGQVNDLNASIRAVPAQVHGIIDAMAIEATTPTSVIHDGPFPPVLDGTHFTSAKAADMAADVAAAIALA